MIRLRALQASDRPRIEALLSSVSAFMETERSVALELVDARLAHPDIDDYRFILGEWAPTESPTEVPELVGYICYGHTPMTQSTYDLYWLGTSPAFEREGIARDLIACMEAEIAREGGGLVRVETGSREGHGGAVHFYDAMGFTRTATIPDFYAPADDLLIFTKRVTTTPRVLEAGFDEAALYDAAFGYRNYVAERDFLLSCARRFGEREVRRVIAWASGPGRHLKAFADAGIGGVGFDGSMAMIAYARRTVVGRPGSADVHFVHMALDEQPPDNPAMAPADLSFVPLSSIHLLNVPDAIRRHLRVASSLLRSRGLHVIEATHPADLTPSGVHHTEWTEVRGDATVDARFRMHIERLTPDRVVPVTLEVIRSPGTKRNSGVAPARGSSPEVSVEVPTPRLRQEDRWFIPDLEGWRSILAGVPEFELIAALGDFNVEVPFEHTAAWRLILVLKKVE